MCVLILSTILSEIFLILSTVHRNIIINEHTSLYETPIILLDILMKLESSRQIFEKCPSVKYHENPSVSRKVPCGWKDEQT